MWYWRSNSACAWRTSASRFYSNATNENLFSFGTWEDQSYGWSPHFISMANDTHVSHRGWKLLTIEHLAFLLLWSRRIQIETFQFQCSPFFLNVFFCQRWREANRSKIYRHRFHLAFQIAFQWLHVAHCCWLNEVFVSVPELLVGLTAFCQRCT